MAAKANDRCSPHFGLRFRSRLHDLCHCQAVVADLRILDRIQEAGNGGLVYLGFEFRHTVLSLIWSYNLAQRLIWCMNIQPLACPSTRTPRAGDPAKPRKGWSTPLVSRS